MQLQKQRWETTVSRDTRSRSGPGIVRILLGAAFVTLLLAGTYESGADAAAVFLVTTGVGAWRAGRLGKLPQGWIRLTDKVPVWARLVLAVFLGFVVSYAIQSPGWNKADDLRPVMISALVTVVFVHLLLPLLPSAARMEAE